MSSKPTIAISGGLDPVHVGHVDLINAASEYGDVIIILNSDEWLCRKKGYMLMPWGERATILENLKNVHSVVPVDDSDGTVCEALKRIKPDYFGNGGDRKSDNTPEVELCKQLGIELVWNLGGQKTQSSSKLIEAVNDAYKKKRQEV